jgi:O-antigen/teichoic acid export membrane protein
MAKNLVYVVWRTIDPFQIALMPEIVKLVYSDQHNFIHISIKKMIVGLFFYSIVINTFSYILIHEYGPLFLGKEYVEIDSLFLIMSLWILICAPLIWAHPLSIAIDKPWISFQAGLVSSLLGIILFFWMTHYFGLLGSAVAWVISSAINFLLTSHLTYKKFVKLRIS